MGSLQLQIKDPILEVHLITLSGGHGGDQRLTTLYFKNETPFDLFLCILRETTVLSKIPPASSADDIARWKSDFPSLFAHHEYAYKFIPSPSSERILATALNSRSSEPVAIQRGGYTLQHGPWCWKFYELGKVTLSLTEWAELDSDERYNSMLDKLSMLRKSRTRGKLVVGIIHVSLVWHNFQCAAPSMV